MTTDLASAEMIKYAANAFLATKISFINEISTICELVGADVSNVAALRAAAREYGYEPVLFDAAVAVNGR